MVLATKTSDQTRRRGVCVCVVCLVSCFPYIFLSVLCRCSVHVSFCCRLVCALDYAEVQKSFAILRAARDLDAAESHTGPVEPSVFPALDSALAVYVRR